MSDESASSGEGEAVSVLTVDPGTPAELTMNGAAKALADMRFKRNQESSAESAEPATAEPELAQANAAPETDPGEEPDAAEPAEQPPIEPPRSWTQAEKERFQSLPRETQEYLHTREQERDTAFRRSQNEIAEQRKAVQAERDAAEKARQDYEAKAIASANALLETQNDRFPDIKTWADVERLSRTARDVAESDPFLSQKITAYLGDWNTHQQALQMRTHEAEQAKQRQANEHQSNWAKHVQEENTKAAEFIPDLADKAKSEALTKRVATELLPELGFKDSELADLANGRSKLSIYDHRIQRLLADGLKLRDIQSASKAVAAKPLPPVQKPGTTKPSGGVSERVQALDNSLTNSGSLKAAQQLLAARRASQRRAS